ncbi:MAG: hypothetical protein R3B13_25140 [Polyangiaceae bacterium]
MSCVSSCPSCSRSCKVICFDDSDCQRVGAGTCHAKSCSLCTRTCSGGPTTCGGGTGGSSGGSGTGGSGATGGGGCTPDCSGNECGDDGCGNSCGSCGVNEECKSGQCVSTCECQGAELQCASADFTIEQCDGCSFQPIHCGDYCTSNGYAYSTGCSVTGSSLLSSCRCEKGGIGDICGADEQCLSGECSGWCSKDCEVWQDCDGKYSSGSNVNGFFNTCVATNAGSKRCFPRCATSADCADYPGTTCKDVTTTTNITQKVCSL